MGQVENMNTFQFVIFITSVVVKVLAVPPPICRAEFRWDDCGQQPKPVMYYWKQGSRCEVGIWKGCLPNPNMFTDEYECINTCVFQEHPVERTDPEDSTPSDVTSANETVTAANTTDATNDTTVSVTDHSDGNSSSDATASSETTDHSDATEPDHATDQSESPDTGNATDASENNDAANATEAATEAEGDETTASD